MHYVWFNCDYIIRFGNPELHLICRDQYGRRHKFVVRDFKPHFFVDASEVPDGKVYPVKTIDGREVVKIETKFPREVPEQAKLYRNTYQDNILFPLVFLIEKGIRSGLDDNFNPVDPPDVPPKIVYLDIENEFSQTMGDSKIICITCYDSYSEKYVSFYGKETRKILQQFIDYIKRQDPDVITGWNIQYDLVSLYRQAKKLQLDINQISPLNYVAEREYRGQPEIKISGVTIFDLYDAYKKFFQGKTFDSYKLEDVARKDLDIPVTNFDYETRCNLDHMDEVLELNRGHVKRCVELDKKWNLIGIFEQMRRTVGCYLPQTLTTTQYMDVMMLREYKGKYILPGKRDSSEEQSPYVGALVLDPPAGIFENVICLDVNGMYPTLMIAFNMSPETLTDDDSNAFVIDEHTKFKKRPLGVIPSVLIQLMEMRQKMKQKLKTCSPDQYNSIFQQQYAYKQIIAACYGVFVKSFFRLYTPAMSHATTYLGRQLLTSLQEYVNKEGYQVLYGDTDSLHIKLHHDDDPFEVGNRLANDINTWLVEYYIQELGTFRAPELDFEKVYDRILYTGKKKRYAGYIKSKDEIEVKGFELKRSSSSYLTRDIQFHLFDLILRRKQFSEILTFIRTVKEELPTYPLSYIGIPQPLNKPISQYERQAQRKAIIATQMLTGKEFSIGSRPLKVPVKYIGEQGVVEIQGKKHEITELCLDEDGKLPQGAVVDYDTVFEKVVWKPIEKIFNVLGYDYTMVTKKQRQVGLDEFL